MVDKHMQSVAQRRFNALESYYRAQKALEAAELELTITEALTAGLSASTKQEKSPNDDH